MLSSLMKELEQEIDALWGNVEDNNLSISHDVFRTALKLRRLIYRQRLLSRSDDSQVYMGMGSKKA